MSTVRKYTIVTAREFCGGGVSSLEKEQIKLSDEVDIADYVTKRYSYPVMILKGWPEEIKPYV